MVSPRRSLRVQNPVAPSSADTSTADPGFAAIRAELGVSVESPPEAAAEAEAAIRRGPQDPTAGHGRAGAREDLTALAFVTLDPPGSRDLDQAMHLERTPGGYRVRYAIADTAAFIRPGGALDAAVHRRVTTVYCPDVRAPLHPAVLSEGAASLLPGSDRPAVVWTFELDADADVRSVDVRRALVRSRAQLDYPTEQRRLEAGAGPDDVVTLLAEIGTRRSVLERERGGVSLGRPEQEVVAAPDGSWALELRAPLAVEEHNAQISLMTGMAAAQIMLEVGIGVLRTMPPARSEDLDRLRRQAQALGVPWPHGADYGAALAGADRESPRTAAFLAAATSLFRGAAWTPFDGTPPTDVAHAAVGAPYAHVTAPLRRLVDRYGLEICLAATAGTEPPDWVREALGGIGATMADGAQRQSAVDRACTDLVEALLLAPHVGASFPAVVLGARTVQLTEPPVVARLEATQAPVGDRVLARLVEADPHTRTVRFHLAG